MTRPSFIAFSAALLIAVWVWPLPFLPLPPFSRHMTMHMVVVAVAAPLFALGLAGGRLDPVVRAPRLLLAIPASVLELVFVWAWHAPALHHAARHQTSAFVLEQASFLLAGVMLWAAALGGTADQRRQRAAAGVAALWLTSMHMTLLGALIALTPRVLYAHPHGPSFLTPLVDQQLGGAIMLLVGGIAYLAGGLGLLADLLKSRIEEPEG